MTVSDSLEANVTIGRVVEAARRRLPSLGIAIIWAVLIIVIAWPIALVAGIPIGDYLPAIIPTAVGVLAGVPFALWIVRLGGELTAAQAIAEAAARRRTVLGVLTVELADNLEQLRGERSKRPRPDPVPLLRDETWRALADGGQLRWIEDPELIGRLARAYHRIGTTTLLERQILELRSNPLWRTTSWGAIRELDPMPPLQAMVEDQDRDTIAAIDHALVSIGESQEGV